ncbi:MAG: damage-control phosphatase ARMT1 family protein [Promethearchaeia archaeon]
MPANTLVVPLIPDCSACMVNSLKTLVPLLTKDKQRQFELFSIAFSILATGFDEKKDPATLSIQLYRELYSLEDAQDPYHEIKAMSNQAAKKCMNGINKRINALKGYEKLRAALAAAIAGNMIDFNTAGHDPDLTKLGEAFTAIERQGFALDDSQSLWSRLTSKKGNMVFLADNAGETYFDLPLIEIAKNHCWTVTYVVKDRPMMNDAVVGDIEETGIQKIAEVITSGAWSFGVPRKWVSQQFLDIVSNADVVISKGQANIETFPEIQRDLNVETYYLSRAKCPHIAGVLGVAKGQNVVLKRG